MERSNAFCAMLELEEMQKYQCNRKSNAISFKEAVL